MTWGACTHFHDRHLQSWKKAVLKGYGHLVSPTWLAADTAGTGKFRCTRPVVREAWSRPGKTARYNHPAGVDALSSSPDRRPIGTRFVRRCRTCRECLVDRANHWANAARHEIAAARRTWFVTFTVRPEEHRLAELRAMVASRRAGYAAWEHMTKLEQQGFLLAEFQEAFRLYWMRLRTYSKAPLRYLRVAELHPGKKMQSDGSATSGDNRGRLHFHALIHESGDVPVTKALIEREWKLGFVKTKLAKPLDPRVAFYVTKYMTKEAHGRIWASNMYGKRDLRPNGHSNPPKNSPIGGRFGGGAQPPLQSNSLEDVRENPTPLPPNTGEPPSPLGEFVQNSEQRVTALSGADALPAPGPDASPQHRLSGVTAAPYGRRGLHPSEPSRGRPPARAPRSLGWHSDNGSPPQGAA